MSRGQGGDRAGIGIGAGIRQFPPPGAGKAPGPTPRLLGGQKVTKGDPKCPKVALTVRRWRRGIPNSCPTHPGVGLNPDNLGLGKEGKQVPSFSPTPKFPRCSGKKIPTFFTETPQFFTKIPKFFTIETPKFFDTTTIPAWFHGTELPQFSTFLPGAFPNHSRVFFGSRPGGFSQHQQDPNWAQTGGEGAKCAICAGLCQ